MLGEILQVRREPENIVDKFSVYVEKDDRVVGHFKKGTLVNLPSRFLFNQK